MPHTKVAFVPTLACVRRSLTALVNIKAHENLAGYLCVLFTASAERREDDLRPDFKAFFNRFFLVANAPLNKPYVMPFRRNADSKSLLFNANVAGSYAPSSIRPVSPLHTLMKIEGTGQAIFHLRPDHARAASELLARTPIPLYSFASFLYRDFGFSDLPSREEIEEVVQRDFGFALQGNLYKTGLFINDFPTAVETDFERIEAVP